MNKKRIAFCGTRGIPANYGGFETAVENITGYFLNADYECDVFCRDATGSNQTGEYQGRNLIFIKGSKNRKLDTFISSIKTGLYIFRNRKKYHHVFWFNNANLLGILLTLLSLVPTTVNTDGLEWKRSKWSLPFKIYYFLSTIIIVVFCKRLISDSTSIQRYYKTKFLKNTIFIPYGAPKIKEISQKRENEIMNMYNLQNDKYFLQITRFEPDNLPLQIVEAFIRSDLSKQGYQLVVVGFNNDSEYAKKVKMYSETKGVKVLDAIYNQEILTALRKNCFSYIHGNSVGGTNPALLEAMASCKRVLAIDCVFSHEVLGEQGVYFKTKCIEAGIKEVLKLRNQSNELKKRVHDKYNWESVSECYIEISENKWTIYKRRIETIDEEAISIKVIS